MSPNPLGFLVVRKFGSQMPIAGEVVDMYRVDRPDPYVQSLRHEQYRAEAAAREVALADLYDQLDWCTDDQVVRAVLDLHAPEFDYGNQPVCGGCESDGWESERPEWPCATTRLIATSYGIGVPA